MDELKVKVSAETKQAEQDYKNYLASITASYKQHIASVKQTEKAMEQVNKQLLQQQLENKKANERAIEQLNKQTAREELANKKATQRAIQQSEKQNLAEKKSYLRDWENAIKQNNAFDVKAEKQKLAEKNQANKEYIKQLKFNSSIVNKQIADEQKALSKIGNNKGMSKFQLLEFGENLTVVTAGLVAAGGAAISLGKTLFKAAQDGADFGVLLQSFAGIGGDDAALKLMDIAAAGNIAESELIKFALQMNQVGVTTGQTTLLLDAIERQADLTGRGFADANESVKKFIGTGATRSLVGFMDVAKLKAEVEKLNKEFTNSGKALTDEQAELNRTQAVLNIYGGTVGDITSKQKDNADKIASLSTKYDNLKERAGLALSDALIPFLDNMGKIAGQLGITDKSIGTFLNGFFAELSKMLEQDAKDVQKLIDVFKDLQAFINTMDAMSFGDKIKIMTGSIGGFGQGGKGNGYFEPGFINSAFGRGVDIPERTGGGAEKAGLDRGFFAKNIEQTAEDSNTILSNITTSMNALGIGTDNFIGSLIGGFNTVLTIMEAIKSVNTILSFFPIPGRASGGGISANSPYLVGERGPEIIFPNTSGYVMNNFNSMQVMKSQQQPIYINANLNAMEFYKTGKKDFNILQGFKRIN